MRVVWHRHALPSLRFPQVCPLTGGPVTETVTVTFAASKSRWLPPFWRMVIATQSPPAQVCLAVSAEAAARARRGMYLLVAVVLGWVALFVSVLVSLAFLWEISLVVGLAGGVLLVVAHVAVTRMQDPFGVDVQGDWLSLTKAHPAFAHAFAQLNVPGAVFVDGMPQGR